jgi:hypothetical protein
LGGFESLVQQQEATAREKPERISARAVRDMAVWGLLFGVCEI